MHWGKLVRDYLTFSRKERLGIITLLFLILLVSVLPELIPSRPPALINDELTQLKEAKDSLLSEKDELAPPPHYVSRKEQPGMAWEKGELFIFDPNSLDAEGWKRLGLGKKPVSTIMNYRAKGGNFKTPEDLMRIWGLPPAFYERVKNHIRIQQTLSSYPKSEFKDDRNIRKDRKLVPFDVNMADTTALIALPGIGSKLASRIIIFRDKLGGFHSVNQIGETFGLKDSVFLKIKPLLYTSGTVKMIRINTALKEELASHPYIRWKLANVIVEYRDRHGPYGSEKDLMAIAIMDEVTLEKLRPYIEY